MAKVLISLISAQTLPNIQFIRHFQNVDRYVFLTTKKMNIEGRVNWIVKSSKIKKEFRQVIIDAEKKNECYDNLVKSNQFSKTDEYVVNLTGGTKMMALAAYEYFIKNHSTTIYYIPINEQKVFEIYPNNSVQDLLIDLNLYEYLDAYGINIISENKSYNSRKEEAIKVFNHIAKIHEENKIQRKLEHPHTLSSKEDRKFYSGEWFEIWMTNIIKQDLNISDKHISMSLKLNKIAQPSHSYNEFDVMFVKDNRLFIIECKYFNTGKFLKKKVNQDLYKLGTLRNNMGLYANARFATPNELKDDVKKDLEPAIKALGLRQTLELKNLLNKESRLKMLK